MHLKYDAVISTTTVIYSWATIKILYIITRRVQIAINVYTDIMLINNIPY